MNSGGLNRAKPEAMVTSLKGIGVTPFTRMTQKPFSTPKERVWENQR